MIETLDVPSIWRGDLTAIISGSSHAGMEVIYPETKLPEAYRRNRTVFETASIRLVKSRFCWACGASKTSEEHVFPQWLYEIDDFKEALFVSPFRLSDELKGKKTRDRSIKTITAVIVCSPCNEGWMSKMETLTIPLLRPRHLQIIQRTTITESKSLGQWFIKTAAMLNASQRHAYPLMWQPSQIAAMRLGNWGDAKVYLSRISGPPDLNWMQGSNFIGDGLASTLTARQVVFCRIQIGNLVGTVLMPMLGFESNFKRRSLGVVGKSATLFYDAESAIPVSYDDLPKINSLKDISGYNLSDLVTKKMIARGHNIWQ